MSCRERFQRAYGNGLERQYAAYQKLNRGVSSPINFSHISLVSGLPFSPYPLTDFSTDITHPIREDSCGRLNLTDGEAVLLGSVRCAEPEKGKNGFPLVEIDVVILGVFPDGFFV